MVNLNDVLLAMSNIPVDDPIAEIWGRGLQGGYKIIEYAGSLPITISADGNALIDYRIYGADGGVGEPTENLFDGQGTDNYGYYKGTNGEYVNNKYYKYWRIPVSQGDIIRWTIKLFPGYGCYFSNGVYKGSINNYDSPFIVPADVDEVTNNFRYEGWNSAMVTKNQPIPNTYIPYGYKLPMTVSDGNTAQSVPVYIGENQLDSVEGVADYVDKASGKTVRMIGEYTFTGDESFNKYGNSDVFYTSKTIDPVGITTVNTTTMRCDHPAFTAIENKDTKYWLNPEADDVCCFLPGGMSQVFLRSTSNFTTAAECKAYLKAQYDNGTPVKISYWLKTPMGEDPPVPLPEIPTIKGETVIDYDGEPKPSQMYVKYKGEG